MADIAKFGIEVDPKQGVEGTRKVEQGLERVGQEAETTQRKVDRSFKKQGRSAKGLASVTKSAFGDMTNGMIDLLDGIGLLNNGFGALIRRGQNLNQAGTRMRGAFGGMATQGAAAGAGAQAAASGIGAAGGAATATRASMGALLPILGAVAAGIIGIVVATKTLTTTFSLLKQGLAISADMETTATAMEVMLGSASGAQRMIADITEFSNVTPFEPAPLIEASKVLLNFGVAGDQILPTLRRIGDVSGGSGEKLSSLALVFGQVASNGKLMGQDLLQFINAGFNPLQNIAERTGKSMTQLRDEMSKGLITFDMVNQAFIDATSEGGKFEGMLAKISETFNGKVSTVRGLWSELLKEFATPTRDALKPILDDIIIKIREATPLAQELGQKIANSISLFYGDLPAIRDELKATKLEWGYLADSADLSFADMRDDLAAFVTDGGEEADEFRKAWDESIGSMPVNLGFALKFASNEISRFVANSINELKRLESSITDRAMTRGMDDETKNAMARSRALYNKRRGLAGTGLGAGEGADPFDITGKSIEEGFMAERNRITDEFEATRQETARLRAEAAQVRQSNRAWQFMQNSVMNQGGGDPNIPEFLARPEGLNAEGQALMQTLTNPTGGGASGAGGGAAAKVAKESKQATTNTQELLKAWQDVDQQFDDFTAGTLAAFSGGISNGFMDLISGAKDAKTAFADMATSIVSDILRMIVQMTIQLGLQRALGMTPYGAALQAGAGAVQGAAGGAATFHSGGIAGMSGAGRSNGLSSSEAVIRVDRNETILTRKRSQELEQQISEKRESNQEGRPIQILNITDPAQIYEAIAARPDVIVNALSRRAPAVRQIMAQG